ncbi:MAG: hypothetical protein EOO33_12575 [Comamonadaceae bacterium]|nr:MAG: hypothetical protein EOO33_12575 [Comamonadaceae bacterium]
MNALFTPATPSTATPSTTPPSTATSRSVAHAALAGITVALVWAASADARAQIQQTQQIQQTDQTAATPSARAEPAPPPGRTRAEVIAELECARASGELDEAVLHSYGLTMAPQQAASACGHRAGRPASTAKN